MNFATNEDIKILKTSKLFNGVDDNLLLKSIEGSRILKLQRKESLFTLGDPIASFAIILSGAVKLMRPTLNGENIIMHIAITGEIIGGIIMNQGSLENYPISAVAMIPCRIISIPRSTFQSVWKNEIIFQTKLNTLLYRRMSNLQDDKTFFSSPLKVRLVMLLTRYLDKSHNENPYALVLPLTRQEIADSLGVAVESVIRIVSEWSREGIIKTTDRVIEIINYEQLVISSEL